MTSRYFFTAEAFSRIFDGVADGDDRLSLVVRNLDPELLLERHDQLNRIEQVGPEIVDEIGALDDLVGFHAEVLDDDLLHALCDIAHLSSFLHAPSLPARLVN